MPNEKQLLTFYKLKIPKSYKFLLFPKQSLVIMKKIAAINMKPFCKTNVHRFLRKCLFTLSMDRVFIFLPYVHCLKEMWTKVVGTGCFLRVDFTSNKVL